MTIEEKAKAYDEALERKELQACGSTDCDAARQIFRFFPELQESEDELTWLTKYIEEEAYSLSIDIRDNEDRIKLKNLQRSLAWLEKQGEQKAIIEGTFVNVDEIREDFMQEVYRVLNADPTNDRANQIIDAFDHLPTIIIHKPADNVEPKFKIGDWVVSKTSNLVYHVDSILFPQSKCYYLSHNGSIVLVSFANEQNYHLWTIQNAKDGDVLFHSDSASNGIFIFKEIIDRGFAKEIICYCDYDSEDHFCLGEHHTCCWTNAKILHPATKEQRDTLFAKMKEAGYTFDFDKKELRKIEQKPVLRLSQSKRPKD